MDGKSHYSHASVPNGAAILDAVPAETAVLGTDGVILAVNAAWSRFGEENGYSGRDSCVGQNYLDICRRSRGACSENAGQIADGIEEVLRGGRNSFSLDYPCAAPGRERWFRLHCVALPTSGALISHFDITRAKAAEDSLRRSEAEYRICFDANPHPMWLYDRETHRFLMVNDAALERYGYSRSEFLEMNVFDIRPSEEIERFREYERRRPHGRLSDPSRRGIWRHKAKSGEVFDVEILRSEVEFGGKTAVLVLVHDVTEMMRIERDMKRLNADLERRVTARTAHLQAALKNLEAFSSSVSHDLRAPLRKIDYFTKMIIDDPEVELNARGRDFFGRVRSSVRLMAQLIDDLLKLARVTRGDMKLVTVDMSALAEAIVADLRRIDPQRKVKVSIRPAMTVIGDANLLRAMLENLLQNAWKFSANEPAAEIEFGIEEERGGGPVYFVADNGVGFDMSEAGALFQPFVRLHPQASFGGTGIGLATVARIIERHGGRIWPRSEQGHGARFCFTLHETPEPDAGWAVDNVILMVENDPEDAFLTLRSFERAGFPLRIDLVRDGREALEYLKATGPYARRKGRPLPALITLDWMMPRMSGSEFLRAAKADPDLQGLKVVILSSSVGDDDPIAHHPDVLRYMPKPMNADDAPRVVEEIVAVLREQGVPLEPPKTG
jgi:PAS domain S-box-containing protein